MQNAHLSHDGLILSASRTGDSTDSRALRRDVERGLLIKLRRGAYVERSAWDAASAREKHVFRIRAVVAASPHPLVIAGVSAAAVWGMPVARWPTDDVLVLDTWHGGGRREPGVKHTSVRATSAQSVVVGGLAVTTLARTAIDVARRTSFADGAGSIDWVLWRRNPRAISVEELFEELMKFEGTRAFRHLQRLVDFATPLSDSFGESEARAVIQLLGFAQPELQVPFRDRQGAMYPDFFWSDGRVAAEFDGKQKYTRNEFTDGDPAEVLWREKKREDRLRRQVSRVERILTAEVKQPARLEALLVDAGVPRAFSRSGRRN